MLYTMSGLNHLNYSSLYAGFQHPITNLDCGHKCAPYNQHAAPFCCDTRHAVPTADIREYEYLISQTNLWHPWQALEREETYRLQKQKPPGHVLIECQGHQHCIRQYRSITCRAFPFFPYLTQDGGFIGMSYYWEYETRCWVISHLDQVSPVFLVEFIASFEKIFRANPVDIETFQYHSYIMRMIFSQRRRAIPLLHRNGCAYKISPASGRMRKHPAEAFPKFGPYLVAARLTFPEERV